MSLLSIKVDVSNPEDIEHLFEFALEKNAHCSYFFD